MASENFKKDIIYNSFKYNKKDVIPSLDNIKNSSKNIYTIESLSGREKKENKDYKLRNISLFKEGEFSYNDYNIEYLNKEEIRNIDFKSSIYFFSVDAFIEYYNCATNKKIETQDYVDRIKDRLKQKTYKKLILPAYKLKSKDTKKEKHFYITQELDILDFLIDNFEFGTDIREILYNINLDYVCFIERKIKALYKQIIKIKKSNNEKIYYDYKLYYIAFFIYDYYRQKRINKKDYYKLIDIYKKAYKKILRNKENEKYFYYGEEVENKSSYYNIDLLKKCRGLSYNFKDYINLHYKLIDYQIDQKRYLKRYTDFFSSQILVFLYFLGHISKADFLALREKIKNLEEMGLPLKKYNIDLEEEEENIIFEVSSANNYNMLLIDYIELYNFTRLYHKNSIKNSYKKYVQLMLKSSELKKILK
ncbi:hypothetical protein [uncultured Brachyspira sp.]|uniref:hypothetical protein n=1 Tax=uncultured Brachyspira sp. TaxID=221953 RepID=UPI0025DC8043|nr:hypothetical protein [uncultured Brachyspira sp.]